MATDKTPSGHGSQKPFERKAPEAKRDPKFAQFRGVSDDEPIKGMTEAAVDMYEKMHPKPAAKPVENKPEPVRLNGPMLYADVQAALGDRYPHNTPFSGSTRERVRSGVLRFSVPTGYVEVDIGAVNKCKNTAELRAYIDALPIQ